MHSEEICMQRCAGSTIALRGLAAARALALAFATILTFAFVPPAAAQGFNFFQNWFQPQQPSYYPQQPTYKVERRQRPRVVRKVAPPPVEKQEAPAVPPSFFVAVLGDSLGVQLGQGLTEAFADRPEVAILRKAREDTGLVRADFYDWVKASQDLLASNEKINVAVILIGSNDHQFIRDGAASYEPHAPKWDEIYAARIEAIANQFREKKIPLIWVGLPILKSERMSQEALKLNEMYKDHAEKAGATYVDIWEAFADDHGGFAASGPDVEGQIVRLRAADGIHFTKAGGRKLANFVEDEIKRVLDSTEPDDASNLAKLSPEPQGPTAPAVDVAPALPRQKPPVGPVLSLTGPPVSPDAALVSRVSTGAQPGPAISEEAHEPPKAGRADDFSWPQQ
jgi:uncharacterized protein